MFVHAYRFDYNGNMETVARINISFLSIFVMLSVSIPGELKCLLVQSEN